MLSYFYAIYRISIQRTPQYIFFREPYLMRWRVKKALKVFIHGFTKRNEIQKEALAPFWVCEQMELLKNQKKRKQPLKQISIVV